MYTYVIFLLWFKKWNRKPYSKRIFSFCDHIYRPFYLIWQTAKQAKLAYQKLHCNVWHWQSVSAKRRYILANIYTPIVGKCSCNNIRPSFQIRQRISNICEGENIFIISCAWKVILLKLKPNSFMDQFSSLRSYWVIRRMKVKKKKLTPKIWLLRKYFFILNPPAYSVAQVLEFSWISRVH